MKWEICSTENFIEAKRLALCGWELVSVTAVTRQDYDGCTYVEESFYFKREKPEDITE